MLPEVKKIIEVLSKQQVEFIIIGGMAAVAQGAPVTTFDLDICYRREPKNIKRLVDALSEFNPKLRNAPKELPFIFDKNTIEYGCNFALSTDVGDIDLFGEVEGVGGYDEIKNKAIKLEIFGFKVDVMHISDLIKAKEKMMRPKDRASIEILKETFRLKKQKGVVPY
jgi:predicted nucleotidyltransferase